MDNHKSKGEKQARNDPPRSLIHLGSLSWQKHLKLRENTVLYLSFRECVCVCVRDLASVGGLTREREIERERERERESERAREREGKKKWKKRKMRM